ncbi:MAG: HAD hydrolase-like protein [Cyanobacteria bacterium SZAS LIN-3]|nr:HAD hydrolase-like protein [Cyanobacteria bacterium SZAS LIN-3]MBS2009311.1 HAD hydrolase-like protein [Cyanobacteria bacterium SZAS TMP-1]
MQRLYRAPQSKVSDNVLLLDLDNTLTDTRRWFADFILDATAELAEALDAPVAVVNALFAEVALATTLHEYAFAVEAISCRLAKQRTLSYKKIRAASEQFWQRFARAHESIELYAGVKETLYRLRAQFRDLKIVILTDSPEWVALERLALTGTLPLVDGVVAIRTEDPRLRQKGYRDSVKAARRRIEVKQQKIDKQHLLLNMAIPASFAKPSSAGIELAARRLGFVGGQIVICGDKDTKEGQAAAHWRNRQHLIGLGDSDIHYVRAQYGNHDLEHGRYVELARHIRSLARPICGDGPTIQPSGSIDSFPQLIDVISPLLSGERRKPEVA